jgi:uncharacterized membrane protein
MANKNRNLIIAYFPSEETAETAAQDLKQWDKKRDDVKLGGIGIITVNEKGKLKTRKVGARAGGTGAKWGTILGVTAGIFSGGVTVIGGAVVGLAAGSIAGALFHKHIGMDDDDKERLAQHLQDGGAALAVMADDDEVEPAKGELITLGGTVESYVVPDETVDEIDAAGAAADVEDADEAVLDHTADAAVIAAAAGAAAAVAAADEEEDGGTSAVIHYHRHNGDYEGWGLHVWTGFEGDVEWEGPLWPAGSDDFGIYFEVPVAEGAEGLAYIIHRGDEKDQWNDQYLDFAADGSEVWIMQNTPGYVDAPEPEVVGDVVTAAEEEE